MTSTNRTYTLHLPKQYNNMQNCAERNELDFFFYSPVSGDESLGNLEQPRQYPFDKMGCRDYSDSGSQIKVWIIEEDH